MTKREHIDSVTEDRERAAIATLQRCLNSDGRELLVIPTAPQAIADAIVVGVSGVAVAVVEFKCRDCSAAEFDERHGGVWLFSGHKLRNLVNLAWSLDCEAWAGPTFNCGEIRLRRLVHRGGMVDPSAWGELIERPLPAYGKTGPVRKELVHHIPMKGGQDVRTYRA